MGYFAQLQPLILSDLNWVFLLIPRKGKIGKQNAGFSQSSLLVKTDRITVLFAGYTVFTDQLLLFLPKLRLNTRRKRKNVRRWQLYDKTANSCLQ
jgi:hypothetical protein